MVGTWWRTKATTIRRALAVGSVAAVAVALMGAGAGAAAAAPPAKPGKLATLVLSPATATIAPGGSQAYTAQGLDAAGNSLGDVTAQATFTISAGSCTANRCTATAVGPHTVTGTIKKVSGTASLTVAAADLAAGQTVSNASPFAYASVTFTSTVTNTSTTSAAAGVTAAVTVPAGLTSPAVTTSTGSYSASTGTWTIGSLAPGASATLTLTADAAAAGAGAQTVTVTAKAATSDPNPANNTASASETSLFPPVRAVITVDPASSVPINICAAAPEPVTTTFDGSALNAANPAAPPSSVGTVVYTWGCTDACPAPVNNTSNSSVITFNNADFVIGKTYTLVLTVTPNNPPQAQSSANLMIGFTTVCIP